MIVSLALLSLGMAVPAQLSVALGAPAGAPEGPGTGLPRGEVVRNGAAALEYASDFFVFVGRDAEGRGAVFAFDANRGKEQTRYQAEHFSVLWLQGRGWVELGATGDVPAGEAPLSRLVGAPLPSGPVTTLSGSSTEGLVLTISAAQLVLETDPVRFVTDRRLREDVFATGHGEGRLTLGERSFRGVVHHELCYLVGTNPMARTYTDLFGDGFHSVYGLVGESGALRMHQSGGRMEPLIGRRCGLFAPSPDAPGIALSEPRLSISKKSLGGLFRWPGRYTFTAAAEDPALPGGRLQVELQERKTLINYVFGGVAIAVAEGELRRGEERERFLGFSLIVL